MGRDLIVVGLAFLSAGLLARAGGRIGLPTIPLFMGAGILIGPHTPGPVLFHDPAELELLAAFGLIFLLFSLGLEFSLDDLGTGGRSLLGSALVCLLLNVGGGLVLGFSFGWGWREALVIAGATGVSSSAIVTKLLIELRRLGNPETRLILGIIVVEDVFLAIYLAALTPVFDRSQGAATALGRFTIALAFLLGLTALARWGSRSVRRLLRAPSAELAIVLVVGFTLTIAGVAAALGISDAIGAFMAGLIVAAAIGAERIERLILPLRDAFAALFFFSFGLTIDLRVAGRVLAPVMIAVVLSVVLAIVASVVVGRINGLDRGAAANVGFSVLARGEFALILVALAEDAHLDARVAPFVAVYVFILAALGPYLASRSESLVARVPTRA